MHEENLKVFSEIDSKWKMRARNLMRIVFLMLGIGRKKRGKNQFEEKQTDTEYMKRSKVDIAFPLPKLLRTHSHL